VLDWRDGLPPPAWGRGGCGWWERPPAAICRRVAREARLIDDLQRISPPATLTDGTEVSRRQAVIMSPGRQFQLTSHDASYLELALRTGFTLATFDARLAGARRQVGERAHAQPDCPPSQRPFPGREDRHMLRSAGSRSRDSVQKRVRAPSKGDSGAENGLIRRKIAPFWKRFIDVSMAWLGPTRVEPCRGRTAGGSGRSSGQSSIGPAS
jgi:hypothetical protein